MSTRHKHADVAIAFAEGKAIQRQHNETKEWTDWMGVGFPSFFETDHWRIKPAEPVVMWLWANKYGGITNTFYSETEIKPNDYTIKLEWSRTEFPSE